MNEAVKLFTESKYQEALSKIAQAEKNVNNKPFEGILYAKGACFFNLNDYPKAIETLQAALSKGIASPEETAFARLHLGIAQYRAGQADAARTTWAEVKSDNGTTVLAQTWTLISKIKA